MQLDLRRAPGEFSSAWLERLPYKQKVIGLNPIIPTYGPVAQAELECANNT